MRDNEDLDSQVHKGDHKIHGVGHDVLVKFIHQLFQFHYS